MVLADTSAWIWSRRASGDVRLAFDTALSAELIATCDVVKLELLALATDEHEHDARRRELDALRHCRIGPAEWDRACEVQKLILREEPGAVVRPQTLLVAAAAELAGLKLIHYDEDFDRIAAVTNQPAVRLSPRGSLEP